MKIMKLRSLQDVKPSGKNSVEITLMKPPADELMVPENFSLNNGDNKSVSVIIEKSI